MTVADRIAVMDHGKLIQVAGPSEIYEQPNSRYVADFIGDINIIEGKVTGLEGTTIRMAATSPAVSIVIDDDAETSVGASAWLAVRPEKVRISHDEPIETGVNAVAGTVWDIAYIGDVSVYHVKLDDGVMMRATVANVSRTVERPIAWEDRVWLTWSRNSGVVLTS